LKEPFLLIINQNQGLILKVCNMYCDTKEDREDLFQDIVLQLWRSYPSFQKGSKISTWMYRVALNTAITRVRKEARREKFAELGTEAFTVPTLEGDTDEHLLLMYQGIKQLSQVDQALTLLYLEECSYKEIAEIMGLSESNVGFKLNKIKTRLRALVTTGLVNIG
jgi:RNA polymerase sigma-70 factor, ECF subfamily